MNYEFDDAVTMQLYLFKHANDIRIGDTVTYLTHSWECVEIDPKLVWKEIERV